MYKNITVLLVCAVIATMCTACGRIKSAKELYKLAKQEYGDCTLVSKNESGNKTEIVVHDKLQDFDYKVISDKSEISIDDSSFGSVANVRATFQKELKNKVLQDTEPDIKLICGKHSVEYEMSEYDLLFYITTDAEYAGRDAALECYRIFNNYNEKHRLEKMEIIVRDSNGDDLGKVKISEGVWMTPDDISQEYYTEEARLQTDKKAKFVRKESGIFADTGADLKRVVSTLGSDYPMEMNSPVVFYYFETEDGREYYLCDFCYYDDEEYNEFGWYTNY